MIPMMLKYWMDDYYKLCLRFFMVVAHGHVQSGLKAMASWPRFDLIPKGWMIQRPFWMDEDDAKRVMWC